MRPVNLIPPEDRRGDQAPLRRGALVYLVVGGVAAILISVTVLVLVGNQISDSRAEVARLEREDSTLASRAQELTPYTQFRALSEERASTVSSLADSRFDWERVMRELALVLPRDVWLVDMTATAAPGASIDGSSGGAGSPLRAAAAGPALELNGCGSGQTAVAGFITALKDIDGVTRVGVESSELPDDKTGAGVSSSGEAGPDANEDCRTRDFIAKFKVIVAFDAAPVSTVGASAEVVAPPESETESGTTEESTEGS